MVTTPDSHAERPGFKSRCRPTTLEPISPHTPPPGRKDASRAPKGMVLKSRAPGMTKKDVLSSLTSSSSTFVVFELSPRLFFLAEVLEKVGVFFAKTCGKSIIFEFIFLYFAPLLAALLADRHLHGGGLAVFNYHSSISKLLFYFRNML